MREGTDNFLSFPPRSLSASSPFSSSSAKFEAMSALFPDKETKRKERRRGKKKKDEERGKSLNEPSPSLVFFLLIFFPHASLARKGACGRFICEVVRCPITREMRRGGYLICRAGLWQLATRFRFMAHRREPRSKWRTSKMKKKEEKKTEEEKNYQKKGFMYGFSVKGKCATE